MKDAVSALVGAAVTLLLAGVASFALVRFGVMPDSVRADTLDRLGAGQSLLAQFANDLAGAVQGQFGRSADGQDVATLVADRLQATCALLAGAALVSLLASATLARLSGRLSAAADLLIGSVPLFVAAVWAARLPLGSDAAAWATLDGAGRAAVPMLVLAAWPALAAVEERRRALRRAQDDDRLRFARARGLSRRVLHREYGVRLVRPALWRIGGRQLASVLVLSPVVETVFAWPGDGALLVHRLQAPDPSVTAALLLMYVLALVALRLLTGLLAASVSPPARVRHAM